MAEDKKRFHKVVIQSLGTRGDCQPMAAIAMKLQEEGYDVTILAPQDSVAFVQSLGVKARHVFADVQDALNKGDLKESMATGDTNKFITGMTEMQIQKAPETIKLWYEAIQDIKPDVCISGTLCDFLGIAMVRVFNIPTITVGLQPLPENPPKMVLGLPNIPCCGMNKRIVAFLMKTGTQGEFDGLGVELKKQYGIDHTEIMHTQECGDQRINPAPHRRCLVGCDPIIGEMFYGGKDKVHPRVKLLGFFAVDQKKQTETAKQGNFQKQKSNQFGGSEELEELTRFCSAGDPPVYMGFGSMTARTPEHMIRLLCIAAKRAKTRAIICKGWAKLNQELLEKASKDPNLIEFAKQNILFVGNTPHEWLFPKCSCIVHHGGAGTTSTASRAGVPQIITPVWLDQWDMAHFLNEYGSGVGFRKQLTEIAPFELGDAIRRTQTDEKLKAKALEWQRLALQQQGSADFVKEFHAWWDEEVVTGNWARANEEEVKKCKK